MNTTTAAINTEIQTSLTCNLHCTFCNSAAAQNLPRHGPAEIISRLAALAKISKSVTFTGGEPSIDKHLLKYIKAAATLGFTGIAVETNATVFSYQGFAEKLAAFGLRTAIINMPAGSKELYESITQTPGSWENAIAGISRLCETGVETSISIPILPETIESLPRHIEFIAENFPKAREILLHLVEPAAGETTPIAPDALSAALLESHAAAARASLKFRFKPFAGPPPCLLDSPEQFHTLFELPPLDSAPPGTHVRALPECETCFLKHYCPGAHPGLAAARKPRTPGPVFARLVLKQWPQRDPEDQRRTGEATRLVLSPIVPDRDGRFVEEALLRISYSCNQRCLFCWLEPGFENPSHEEVLENIAKLRDYEIGTVCVTGGEPTLNPHLMEYVSLLRSGGARKICLQTNAVELHNPEKAAALAAAGLDFAFVSLHSHDPAASDMLTGMQGSFEKTAAGINNLQNAGVMVLISHVINTFNYKTLPEFVRFVHTRLGRASIAFLNAAPIYGAMMHRGLITRFSDLKAPLKEALDLCHELGVPFSGLATMCGIPLCILDADTRYFPDVRPVKNMQDDSDMMKTAECESCTVSKCCFGVRKNYALVHGTAELRAMRIENFDPPEYDVWGADYLAAYYSKNFGK